MPTGLWLTIPGVSPYVFAFQLCSGRVIVGKGDECELRLLHWSLCSRHAMLTLSSCGNVRLIDLNSRHGTFVNGDTVTDALTRPGDMIRLGKVLLEVCSDPSTLMMHRRDCKHQPLHTTPQLFQQLSSAQQRVARYLAGGLTEKSIAGKLHLSPHTVHTHVKRIYRKLGVNSRSEFQALFTEGMNVGDSHIA